MAAAAGSAAVELGDGRGGATLGPEFLGRGVWQRAIEWILGQAGRDSGLLSRVRTVLIGERSAGQGWPWLPGTSAWVTPTALSLLALAKARRWMKSGEIETRLAQGESYLLQNACADGGWNFGEGQRSRAHPQSYPETTGVVLLALAGMGSRSACLDRACRRAQELLPDCATSEGESWLRLGLLAQGCLPADAPPVQRPPHTIQNAALARLTVAAGQGRHAFLGQ